jgi:transposase-like protein
LIPQGSKETVIEAIDTAVRAGARQTRACEIVGITPRTLQNWHRGGTEDKRKGAQKNVVRKLSDEEREQILSLCTSERFKDMTPLLSGKCNDPGSARELTHLNPSRL